MSSLTVVIMTILCGMREEARHTGFGSPQGCEGVAYKGDLFYGGATRLEKNNGTLEVMFLREFGKNIGPIKGKWVGLKVIMYNIVQNDKTMVKLELWVDKNNNNNWIKATEKIDKGGWGNNGWRMRRKSLIR